MTLTEEQIIIITDHPLEASLSRFSAKLRNVHESSEAWRSDVASLLLALVGSKAAYTTSLRQMGAAMWQRNSSLCSRTSKGARFRFDHFRPLLDAVTTNSCDTDVWAAVVDLIDAVNPSTPPPRRINI
ncbi:serine/threonine-protein kinase Sgk2 [Metarhizium rileyi]|uniref:Serine/threonine-protein kinase Sgk2 n=1 Tax=Metarhizium rileyi (strain RCEF 4871) TaxID=1649241 RepID=A0A162LT48_METRR|nr:serine/threonine-protein kinase Sgk2 [Metarhizium rileyi RCEF 4871]